MKFSDEMLMAYADGELEARERAAIEEAMRADSAVAEAVARHQALRRDVFDAFAGILDEPVPERLRPRGGNVVPLDAARAQRRRLAWPEWGALAATLAVGVLAGGAGWHLLQADDASLMVAQDGVAAQGNLADALSHDLASAPRGDVRIGVSFVSGTGEYCRTFTMHAAAGLACRSGDRWYIPVLATGQAAADTGYRQAAAQFPQAVLEAIDERIAGEALDAQGERAARDRGWRR